MKSLSYTLAEAMSQPPIMPEGRIGLARASRWAAVAGAVVGAAMIALSAALYARLDWAWDSGIYVMNSGLAVVGGAGAILVGLSGWLWFRRRSWKARLAAGAGAAALTLIVGLFAVVPAVRSHRVAYPFATVIEQILERRGEEPVVGAIGQADQTVYYAKGDFRVVPIDPATAFQEKAARLPAVLVARQEQWKGLAASLDASGYKAVFHGNVDGASLVVLARTRKEGVRHRPALLRFAVVGDIAYRPEASRKIAGALARYNDESGPLRAWFLLGDNLSSEGDFADVAREEFEDPFAPVISRRIPVFAILGNHDYSSHQDNAEIHYPLFHMEDRRYYSETFGGGLITFFVLDSTPLVDEPAQVVWLDEALRNCRSTWKVLALHHPLVASDIAHGGSPQRLSILERFLTGQNHVDVVLSGHNHLYERRVLLDGVLHLTSGAGCETVNHPFPPDPSRAAGYKDECAFGVLTATPDTLSIQAINVEGVRVDEALYRKAGPEGRLVLASDEQAAPAGP